AVALADRSARRPEDHLLALGLQRLDDLVEVAVSRPDHVHRDLGMLTQDEVDLLPQQVVGRVGLVAAGDVGGEARVPYRLLIALEEVPVPVGDGPSLAGEPVAGGGGAARAGGRGGRPALGG